MAAVIAVAAVAVAVAVDSAAPPPGAEEPQGELGSDPALVPSPDACVWPHHRGVGGLSAGCYWAKSFLPPSGRYLLGCTSSASVTPRLASLVQVKG